MGQVCHKTQPIETKTQVPLKPQTSNISSKSMIPSLQQPQFNEIESKELNFSNLLTKELGNRIKNEDGFLQKTLEKLKYKQNKEILQYMKQVLILINDLDGKIFTNNEKIIYIMKNSRINYNLFENFANNYDEMNKLVTTYSFLYQLELLIFFYHHLLLLSTVPYGDFKTEKNEIFIDKFITVFNKCNEEYKKIIFGNELNNPIHSKIRNDYLSGLYDRINNKLWDENNNFLNKENQLNFYLDNCDIDDFEDNCKKPFEQPLFKAVKKKI